MKLLELQNQIQELMSVFVTQIKSATAMGRTDRNRVAETILIPLLSEVYGYRCLKNLNDTESENYPGIDLGDEEVRVAIQVTATPTSEKIKQTLQKFVDYRLYEKYDHVLVYVLTEKQNTYSGKGLAEIIQGRFEFDAAKHILDYRDILRTVAGFQVDKAQRILDILRRNFEIPQTPERSLLPVEPEQYTDSVHLNLIEVFFPKTLYIAELYEDPFKDVIVPPFGRRRRKKGKSPRDVVRAALSQRGLKFAVDWVAFEKKIVTFHDLTDDSIPLSKIVDAGTVTPIRPEEFYGVNEDQEFVFKALLRKCLQQKLYSRRVIWQDGRNLFIFADRNGEDKREENWQGLKSNDRVVFERTRKTDKPDETWYCKHLAFETQFRQVGNHWYLLIKPDWFFSYDGYKESFYAPEKVTWLKKKENNSQVYNHFRFLAYFMSHNEPFELFRETKIYPYLWFGDTVSFSSYLSLDDSDWNPPKDSNTSDDASNDADEEQDSQMSFL